MTGNMRERGRDMTTRDAPRRASREASMSMIATPEPIRCNTCPVYAAIFFGRASNTVLPVILRNSTGLPSPGDLDAYMMQHEHTGTDEAHFLGGPCQNTPAP
jgi:hypothetical protein